MFKVTFNFGGSVLIRLCPYTVVVHSTPPTRRDISHTKTPNVNEMNEWMHSWIDGLMDGCVGESTISESEIHGGKRLPIWSQLHGGSSARNDE